MTRPTTKPNRMTCVSLCLWALCVQATQLQAADEGVPPDALTLWYTQPASEWTDALRERFLDD